MTTHDPVLALVTDGSVPFDGAPASRRHSFGPAGGILSGEELMACALAEVTDDGSEDDLNRLARREALLHRLAIDRQRRRRRTA